MKLNRKQILKYIAIYLGFLAIIISIAYNFITNF